MEEAISAAEMQAQLNEKFAADIAKLKVELEEFKAIVLGRLEKGSVPPPLSKQ